LTVQTLIDSGYDPLAYRYLCLQAHYRSELELNWEWKDENTGSAESLDNAQTGLNRLYERVTRVDDEPLSSDAAFEEAKKDVLEQLNDDLNVPKAVARLHFYSSPRLWRDFDAVLGLDFANKAVKREVVVPDEIMRLVEERQAARKARDFARSDALRDEIAALGWEVGDTPQGPTIKPR
jgi:cysteinyl-tRNA synthetase